MLFIKSGYMIASYDAKKKIKIGLSFHYWLDL